MYRPNDKIGPYTLVKRLGQGASGIVWLAERRGALLTTQVALKLPFDEEANLDTITKEAQVWLAATGHPNVLPVIEAIHQKDPSMIISVDTFYSSVAAAACKAGASMVNDISAGTIDRDMLSTVAGLHLPYVCMHLKGLPGTMQAEPRYDDVVQEVLDFFIQRLEACRAAGITDMIIDPGFGFGKTIEHNFTLLKNLSVFRMLGKPLLAGLSRKSTVYKTLGITATEALNGTSVLNTLALHNGASILRVHDVKEAKEVVTLFNAYKKAPPQRGAFPM